MNVEKARAARVAPVPVEQWAEGLLEETQSILGTSYRSSANVYCTMANYPELFKAWLYLGGHLLRRSSLDERDRELVILRTTALSAGSYPFTQHTRIGLEAGLSEADIAAILEGRGSPRWASLDRLLLTAVDELVLSGAVRAGVWAELADNTSTRQTLDLFATVAFYRMASWLLNVCGAQLDDGQQSTLGPVTGPAPSMTAEGAGNAQVRLAPRPLDEWPVELLERTAGWPRFEGRPELRSAGVYGTLAHHPTLFEAIGPMMAHLLVANTLSDRQREVVIVRSCLRDGGAYPYRQHVRIAGEAGVSAADLASLTQPTPHMSNADEHLLVRLVDQLHSTNGVDDDLWSALQGSLSVPQVFDTIVTAGFYGLISFVLTSAGTPLEAGEVVLPEVRLQKNVPTKERK